MNKENERSALAMIGTVCSDPRFMDLDNLPNVYNNLRKNKKLTDTKIGRKFIRRLEALIDGEDETECIRCKADTKNRVLCMECINEAYLRNKAPQSSVSIDEEAMIRELSQVLKNSDERAENRFRDIDDSLLQLASQKTLKSTKRLVWVAIGIGVINLVAMVFVGLFLWKLNMFLIK